MEVKFVESIASLAEAKADAVPSEITSGDRTFIAHGGKLTEIKPITHRKVKLELHTLSAVVDYLALGRDECDTEEVTVYVEGPRRVVVMGPPDDEEIRATHLKVTPPGDDGAGSVLNRWLELDELIVGLMLHFEASEERARLLRIFSHVKDDGSVKVTDDGQSQTVETRSGLEIDEERVDNPVTLVPKRTFPDVKLAPVPFVFRLEKGESGKPRAKLFECDAGAWKVDAIRQVGAQLRAGLAAVSCDVPVVF